MTDKAKDKAMKYLHSLDPLNPSASISKVLFSFSEVDNALDIALADKDKEIDELKEIIAMKETIINSFIESFNEWKKLFKILDARTLPEVIIKAKEIQTLKKEMGRLKNRENLFYDRAIKQAEQIQSFIKQIQTLKKENKRNQAIAQFIGFDLGRKGMDLMELVSSMGLKKEEWLMIKDELDNDLRKEDKQEINDYFKGK